MDVCYAAEDTVTGSFYEFVRSVWIFPSRFGGTMWQHFSPQCYPSLNNLPCVIYINYIYWQNSVKMYFVARYMTLKVFMRELYGNLYRLIRVMVFKRLPNLSRHNCSELSFVWSRKQLYKYQCDFYGS